MVDLLLWKIWQVHLSCEELSASSLCCCLVERKKLKQKSVKLPNELKVVDLRLYVR